MAATSPVTSPIARWRAAARSSRSAVRRIEEIERPSDQAAQQQPVRLVLAVRRERGQPADQHVRTDVGVAPSAAGPQDLRRLVPQVVVRAELMGPVVVVPLDEGTRRCVTRRREVRRWSACRRGPAATGRGRSARRRGGRPAGGGPGRRSRRPRCARRRARCAATSDRTSRWPPRRRGSGVADRRRGRRPCPTRSRRRGRCRRPRSPTPRPASPHWWPRGTDPRRTSPPAPRSRTPRRPARPHRCRGPRRGPAARRGRAPRSDRRARSGQAPAPR